MPQDRVLFLNKYIQNMLKIVLIVVCFFSCVIPLYEFSFLGDKFTYLIYILDLIFLFGIASRFKNKDQSLKTFLSIVSIISLIPFELLFLQQAQTSGSYTLFLLLRLNRILRLFCFFDIMKDWSKRTSVSIGYFRLFQLLFIICISIHGISCLWFFLARFEGFPADSWVILANIDQLSPILQYQRSLYWVVTTVTTIGYGDITPHRPYEYNFVIIAMILGATFYASIIGGTVSIISNLDATKTSFVKKIDSISQFLSRRGVPVSMRHRVRNYYEHIWQKQQGDSEILKFLDDLPKSFRVDILDDLVGKALRKTPLFDHCNSVLKKELLFLLKPVTYDPSCLILSPGEHPDGIYFITSGNAMIEDKSGKEVRKISEGDYFGDFSLIFNEIRTATVRSIDFCEIFILSKDCFNFLKENHKDFNVVLKEIASKRQEMVSSLIMDGIIL